MHKEEDKTLLRPCLLDCIAFVVVVEKPGSYSQLVNLVCPVLLETSHQEHHPRVLFHECQFHSESFSEAFPTVSISLHIPLTLSGLLE